MKFCGDASNIKKNYNAHIYIPFCDYVHVKVSTYKARQGEKLLREAPMLARIEPLVEKSEPSTLEHSDVRCQRQNRTLQLVHTEKYKETFPMPPPACSCQHRIDKRDYLIPFGSHRADARWRH